MGQSYVGEIRMFAGNFAPVGWALCQGQLMPISQNQNLYSLIGTIYGGDGQTTFGLPNLSSRVPVHVGSGYVLGQIAGVEQVTLSISEIPSHSHVPNANTAGTQSSPANGYWAESSLNQFSSGTPILPMAVNALGLTGGSQPHDNMLPFLAVNFIISLFGTNPSPT